MIKLIKKVFIVLGLGFSFNSFAIDIKIEKKEEKIKVFYSEKDEGIYSKVISNLRKINKLNVMTNPVKRGFNFRTELKHDKLSIYHESSLLSHADGFGSANQKANFISNQIFKKIFKADSFFNERLVFVKEKDEIYTLIVSDYEGKEATEILISSSPIMSPDISSDGTMVTYVSFEKVRPSIFMHEVKTNNRKIIANYSGVNAYPKFSNDGRKILMSLSKDGDANLYTYDIGKNRLKKRTNGIGNEISPEWTDTSDFLFSSDKVGYPQTFLYSKNNKLMTRVFKTSAYTISPTYNSRYTVALYQNNGYYGLIRKNNKTKVEKKIIKDFNIESPSISKSGNLIVYSTKENNISILKFIDVDGGIAFSVRYRDANIMEPSF